MTTPIRKLPRDLVAIADLTIAPANAANGSSDPNDPNE